MSTTIISAWPEAEQSFRRQKSLPARPSLLPFNADQVPVELIAQLPWIAWRLMPRGDRRSKVPIDPRTGRRAHANAVATDFDSAARVLRDGRADGVGVVMVDGAGYVALDLDKCRNLETGEVEPWAAKIVADAKSYSEVSVSGTGVHVFVRGKLPQAGMRAGRVELYQAARFIAITGHQLPGTPDRVALRQGWIDGLIGRHFAGRRSSSARLERGGRLLPAGFSVTAEHDEELVAKALAVSQRFCLLWQGHWQDAGDYPSQSEADLALCQVLDRILDKDVDRIDRQFRRSGLMRSKWDSRRGPEGETYGSQTIDFALQTAFAAPTVLGAGANAGKASEAKPPQATPVLSSVCANSVPTRISSATKTLLRLKIDAPPKDLKRELLALARRLKSTRELAGKPHGRHKVWVRRWWEQNAEHLKQWTWGDVWAGYLVAYGSVRFAAGTGKLDQAFAEAVAGPIPDAALKYEPAGKKPRAAKRMAALRKLVMLCYRLQARAGDGVFFLAVREVAELLGIGQTAAAGYLRQLVIDGVIERTLVGNRADGKASEYRLRNIVAEKAVIP
jgi:hypothetical protein